MYSTYTAQKWRCARSAISAAVRVDGDAEVSFFNEPALNHRQPSTLIHSKKKKMFYKKEIAAFPSYLQWWYCFTSIFVDGEFLDGILSPPTVPLHLPTTDISVPDHFGSLSYQKLEIVIY